MDIKTYRVVTDICARLAGRLSDNQRGSVREFYSVGEWELAEAALLLGLAYEGVSITHKEKEQIRSILHHPDNPDLDDVPIVHEVPPLLYRFSSIGSPAAPDPSQTDMILSMNAWRHGGLRLYRSWREPLEEGAQNGIWVYLLQVKADTDELSVYSGLLSSLHVKLREMGLKIVEGVPFLPYQLEVVTEDRMLLPYHTAALTVGKRIPLTRLEMTNGNSCSFTPQSNS